jgi:hypothetical protein
MHQFPRLCLGTRRIQHNPRRYHHRHPNPRTPAPVPQSTEESLRGPDVQRRVVVSLPPTPCLHIPISHIQSNTPPQHHHRLNSPSPISCPILLLHKSHLRQCPYSLLVRPRSLHRHILRLHACATPLPYKSFPHLLRVYADGLEKLRAVRRRSE